uniref:LysM peptidoglycan-binding domain-containing protein n=3 Tax=Flavobacterium sp. TaxID=239 RepID=UPI00404A0242
MKLQVKRLYTTYFFLMLFVSVFSQQYDYKEHIVTKGETIFQIARENNTDVESIYTLNPQFRDQVLEVGNVVFVPLKSVNETVSVNSDEYLTIKVVKGDTKYAISKKYNVSIAELESLNPHIKNVLQIGHLVKVPKNPTSTSVANTVVQSSSSVNNNGEYLVKKGETLWGIAKANSIPLNALLDANRNRLDGVLKTGQYLIIPSADFQYNGDVVNNNSQVSNANDNDGSANYHLVLAGETKFGLSKRYGVSIQALEQKNPQIVPMLKAGQRILISGSYTESNQSVASGNNSNYNQENNTNQESNLVLNQVENSSSQNVDAVEYVSYEVKSKETLFSLSKKASMSQVDFLTLNPSLQNGVKVGEIIKMPKSVVESVVTDQNPQNLPTEDANNLAFSSNLVNYPLDITYSNLAEQVDFAKEVKLTFVFSDEVKSLDEFALQSDEEALALEQYNGVVLAIDSLKKMGANITSKFLNTRANDYKSEAWKTDFLNSDLIVAGFNDFRFDEVVAFAKENDKKVLVPFRQEKISEATNLIYAYPTEYHQKIFMVEYMKSLNANIIVITDDVESEGSVFLRNYDPSIKFAPVDSKGIINNERFKFLLDKNKINYVVLDTDKNSLIISSTNFLLNESNNFGIKLALFKSRELINSPDISDIRLKVLQMIYPAVLNPNESQITSFKGMYVNKFNKIPSKNAKISFEVSMDIMLRILNQTDLNPDLLEANTKYDYMKFHYQSYQSSFWNSGIFIIKYE